MLWKTWHATSQHARYGLFCTGCGHVQCPVRGTSLHIPRCIWRQAGAEAVRTCSKERDSHRHLPGFCIPNYGFQCSGINVNLNQYNGLSINPPSSLHATEAGRPHMLFASKEALKFFEWILIRHGHLAAARGPPHLRTAVQNILWINSISKAPETAFIPRSESGSRASYATFWESRACISPDRLLFPDPSGRARQDKPGLT